MRTPFIYEGSCEHITKMVNRFHNSLPGHIILRLATSYSSWLLWPRVFIFGTTIANGMFIKTEVIDHCYGFGVESQGQTNLGTVLRLVT